MVNNKRSEVWKYFRRHQEKGVVNGICRFCGHTVTNNNATRMKGHLANQCSKVTDAVRQKFGPKCACVSKQSIQTDVCEADDVTTDSDGDSDGVEILAAVSREQSSATASVSRIQNAVDQSGKVEKCKQSFDIGMSNFIDRMDKEEKSEIDAMYSRAVYASASSFAMVENPFWLQFFKRLRPAWKPPSRYQLSGPLLKLWEDKVDEQNGKLMKSCVAPVLMSDGWSDVSNEGHVQFLLATPQPIFLKAVHPEANRHTGEYICHITDEVIQEHHLAPVAFVTDHASNMTKAWELLQLKYTEMLFYGCSSHAFELVASDLLKVPCLQIAHLEHKKISNFFRNKQLQKQVMLEHQAVLNKSRLVCLQSVPTRWSSAYTMMKRNAKLQDVLRISISDVRCQIGAADHKVKLSSVKAALFDTEMLWPLTTCCLKLLGPLRNAIKSTEGDSARASVVPRIWNYVADQVMNILSSADCPLSQEEKALVQHSLSRRRSFSIRQVQCAANLLDPRFCGQDLTPQESRDGLSLVVKLGAQSGLASQDLMTDYMAFKTKGGLYANQLIWDAVSVDMDPVSWWKAFCEGQSLLPVACKLLSLPASVAAVERSNKEYSLQKTKKRNRLSNITSGRVTKVAFNLKVHARKVNTKKCVHTALLFTGGPASLETVIQPTEGVF